MQAYSLDDFCRYFHHCVIRIPGSGKLAYIEGPKEDGKNVSLKTLPEKKSVAIPLNEFNWSDVSMPKLGYINAVSGGKGLYYLVRRVGRITTKGYAESTVKLNFVPQFQTALLIGGGNVDKYVRDSSIYSVSVLDAVFYPEYTSLNESIEKLASRADSFGFALSTDFAVVPGTTAKSQFLLLWKQLPIASSETGKRWNFYSPEYQDIATRNIKGIN